MDTTNVGTENNGTELISFFIEIKSIAFEWAKSFNT